MEILTQHPWAIAIGFVGGFFIHHFFAARVKLYFQRRALIKKVNMVITRDSEGNILQVTQEIQDVLRGKDGPDARIEITDVQGESHEQ